MRATRTRKIKTMEQEPEETLSVLVVDDDPDTLNAIVSIILPLGVNPLEVSSARQALSVLKKNDIACVISDLVMPRMSGMMLLHSMLEQGFHIPFIMTTGYSDKDSAIQALRLGAFDYLEKPINTEDLQSVLREALNVSREQRQLLQILRSQGSKLATGGVDATAEMQIMKMRTLRYRAGALDHPMTKGSIHNWETLKSLFVQEAEPQLTFCLSALDKVLDSPKIEIGFVLRVVQSVRMAGESVRVNDVAELAWALEKALGAARMNGHNLDKHHVAAMRSATELLLVKVQALGSPHDIAVRQALDEVTEALAKRAPAA